MLKTDITINEVISTKQSVRMFLTSRRQKKYMLELLHNGLYFDVDIVGQKLLTVTLENGCCVVKTTSAELRLNNTNKKTLYRLEENF